MVMKTPDIIRRGKDNGEGMVVYYLTTRGTDIFGLAIPNIYDNEEWGLGPTWCYLILGEKTTLIDTGRFGNFQVFKTLLQSIGKDFSDIDRIVITHSHEDHDGNLTEIYGAAKAELWAHAIYRPMIAYHPGVKDGASHPEMPGSCRLCYMPQSFNKNCLEYQLQRSSLKITCAIEDNYISTDGEFRFVFTPGHSADSICIIVENEVIFTGDTILPDITPHPSLAYTFEVNHRILPEQYRYGNVVYGLTNYLKSLNRIVHLNAQPFSATFPGHRLFYNAQFNTILSLGERAREIIRFHIDRCRNILKIIDNRPAAIEQIAVEYFAPPQLRGSGRFRAYSEIRAHIEVMEHCGDARWVGEDHDIVQSTGSQNFLASMEKYLS
ncbi:MBL fold metallo-hydrolase [Chloroflexota bacterium]